MISHPAWAAPPPPPRALSPDTLENFNDWAKCEVQVPDWPHPGVLPVPEIVAISGVTVRFWYDPTDRKNTFKKQAMLTAVVKLLDFGFILPPIIDVNLVKTELASDSEAKGMCVADDVPAVFLTKHCGLKDVPAYGVSDVYAVTIRKQVQASQPEVPVDCNNYAKRRGREAECEATAIHELCHALYFAQSPNDVIWGAMKENALDPHGGWIPASTQVSRYARENRNEFVAEVCSALVLGMPLPDPVLDAYSALGGPLPGLPAQPRP